MKRVRDEDLKNINGGISVWIAAGICVAVTFIAGIIDGIARPRKCNS